MFPASFAAATATCWIIPFHALVIVPSQHHHRGQRRQRSSERMCL